MATFEQGAAIPELKVTPDRFLPVRYAGASGDFNPIHTDKEYATMVGLPSTILHGLWSMAQVARAVTDAAGGPANIESLEVQFRGMGFPEKEITVSGTVREAGEVATLDVVAEQDGKQIIRNAVATVKNG
ncbi:MAG: MaoC/PaaZ C-terminal domain-containing protein [Solirubrobacteraceae bacterium]|nr:MaoC/PaaZ C-terminal domain-containing protein [Solirubrobacteraceae bacterium]